MNSITQEEESAIAHEMGHLWLMLEGSPQVKRTSDTDKQTAYDTFFGPLREFMEHAVFYPRLKKEYQIDLYKIGSKRLFDFIKEQLPNFKSKADNEKLLLLLNYIKYYVESDNNYWRKRLQNQYSKKHLMDIKEIAENVLHIILKLPDRPFEPEYFITKYYEILTFLETRFSVPRALWPQFIKN